MDGVVAMAVLGASLLHASWHALIKSSGDQVASLAGMNLVAGVVALAALPFVSFPAPAVFAIIAGSVLLHAGYKIALASLYRDTDLGQAYPIARGLTPIAATILGVAVLRELPAATVLSGIALISLGIMALFAERTVKRLAPATLVPALLVGSTVAAYSVVDAFGVRRHGDWLGFTAWLVALDCAVFVGYAFVVRGRGMVARWRAERVKTFGSGCLGLASFCVFMWALGRAPVGAVSALRETSVVFAAVIGALFLGEAATWRRYAAAVIVMLGVVVVSVAR
jgi:drug/metabolite transporter (DMT)-like permease